MMFFFKFLSIILVTFLLALSCIIFITIAASTDNSYNNTNINNYTDNSISKNDNGVTYDPGFGCGNRNWGIKNYQNNKTQDYSFGSNNNCQNKQEELPIPVESGIKNYVKVMAETKFPSEYSTAWQGAIQGVDPWGIDSENEGGAIFSNDVFPLPADLDYQIEVKYLWFGDNVSKPGSENDDLKASVLVDLWFADTKSPKTEDGQYSNVLVIDLVFSTLENKGGKWGHSSFMFEGSQYAKPFAEKNETNNQTIYHYNIVLDTDGQTPMKWHAPSPATYPKTLKDIIDDAFAYNYKFEYGDTKNNHSNNTNLLKSNFQLVDIEAGVEILNGKESTGTMAAAFSLCKLTYK